MRNNSDNNHGQFNNELQFSEQNFVFLSVFRIFVLDNSILFSVSDESFRLF